MKALLVVDMQVGCFSGEPPRWDRDGVVGRINALARALRPLGLVVFIQHTSAADGYERGSESWKLLPTLDVLPGDSVVEKTACDSFLETNLEALLRERGVSELAVVGCATDFCVDTTVRSAASHGFEVVVPSDAHTTRDRPYAKAEVVRAHHNYVWADFLLPRQRKIRVLPTAALLVEWSRT